MKPPRNQGTGRYTLDTAGTDPKFTARVVDFGLAHTHASVESREASGPAPSRALHQKSGSTGAEDQPKQILLVGYTTGWRIVNASALYFLILQSRWHPPNVRVIPHRLLASATGREKPRRSSGGRVKQAHGPIRHLDTKAVNGSRWSSTLAHKYMKINISIDTTTYKL